MSSTTWGGFTAPRFTDEEKLEEWDAMSAGEHSRIRADVMGDKPVTEKNALMSSQLITQLLSEVDRLPQPDTEALREARQRCPEEVFNERRLDLFLLREDYDVTKAAVRVAKYWAHRKKLFGPDKFYLPLTQDGALRDDQAALQLGLHQMLPHPDSSNRVIILYDPSRINLSAFRRDALVRACWYMFESCLESRYIRSGIVILMNGKLVSFEHFDRKLEKAIYELERYYLPIKVRSIHIIKPRSQIFNVLKPLLFFLLGRRLRSRSQVHSGSSNEVLVSLTGYGMAYDVLPTDIGGNVTLDHSGWLNAKRMREQRGGVEAE